MQENLKQALVRGVCALNRHALTAFHPPAPHATATAASTGSLGSLHLTAAALPARPPLARVSQPVPSSMPPRNLPSSSYPCQVQPRGDVRLGNAVAQDARTYHTIGATSVTQTTTARVTSAPGPLTENSGDMKNIAQQSASTGADAHGRNKQTMCSSELLLSAGRKSHESRSRDMPNEDSETSATATSSALLVDLGALHLHSTEDIKPGCQHFGVCAAFADGSVMSPAEKCRGPWSSRSAAGPGNFWRAPPPYKM